MSAIKTLPLVLLLAATSASAQTYSQFGECEGDVSDIEITEDRIFFLDGNCAIEDGWKRLPDGIEIANLTDCYEFGRPAEDRHAARFQIGDGRIVLSIGGGFVVGRPCE